MNHIMMTLHYKSKPPEFIARQLRKYLAESENMDILFFRKGSEVFLLEGHLRLNPSRFFSLRGIYNCIAAEKTISIQIFNDANRNLRVAFAVDGMLQSAAAAAILGLRWIPCACYMEVRQRFLIKRIRHFLQNINRLEPEHGY